ncbi:Alpha/Beta hydrolase protein [Xylariales sp. PMI_506]|nr:Alpha/Beta hydrolase protein [Xylariales sp. PMI_506]
MNCTVRDMVLVAVVLSGIVAAVPRASHLDLPIVDLGYELHQALSYDNTTDAYTFSNIRYAQAPVGALRFRAPVPPMPSRDIIQNGTETRVCPQGIPAWQNDAFRPIAEFTFGAPYSLTAWEEAIKNSTTPGLTGYNNFTTEDCLFLDVHVPKKVLAKTKTCNSTEGAPVLVWIHGGGYTLGSKTGSSPAYNPSGLLTYGAEDDGEDGVIFVALNYRLGALGFLSGHEVATNGDLNAGLLDQRLALQWVQKYIGLFGGSSDKVTVMGESAGGGSILLHLAANGENKPNGLFSRAIVQSPAYMPTVAQPTTAYDDFLAQLNVTSLDEARKLSSEQIITANANQIEGAPHTNYIYGPVQDGHIVRGLPGAAFKQRAFDQSVQVLAGLNSLEGGYFYDPSIETNDEFRDWTAKSIVGLTSEDVDYLASNLYPPQFDGSLGYVDQASRQMALWGEAVIVCNVQFINQALGGRSYAYEFSVPPGVHIEDLFYTFNDPSAPALYPTTQSIHQQALISFAVNGVPMTKNVSGLATTFRYPQWGTDQTLVNLTSTGAQLTKSDINQTRCDWWQAR